MDKKPNPAPFRKLLFVTVGTIVILVLGTFLIFHFRHKNIAVDRAFSKYIESYTTGVISKENTIRIRLASDVSTTHVQNDQLPDGIFDFSPSVKGKAYWVDERTIEFRPDGKLTADQAYSADFRLDKIIDVPSQFDDFKFSFQTIKPDFTVSFVGLRSATNTSLDKMKMEGEVQTADAEESASVEKLISASYTNPVHISWQHNPVTRTHQFTVTELNRARGSASPLTINWDGSSLNIDKKGNKNFDIPAIGDFKVLNIQAIQDNDQYVLVQFSDPVMVGQELNGLTGIKNIAEPSYTIDGSTVKLFAPERLDGNYTAFVNEGVENIVHKKITQAYTANVFFENRMPSVEIPGKGVILPDSGRLSMPFEAVNLNAVDVSIVKIYENNVPQYFQTNDFNGSNELRMVGRPVLQKTIRLDQDKSLNLNKKNRFMLDIDKLLRAEPGAIYRVIIGFRKEYSLFNCKAGTVTAKSDNSSDEEEGGDVSDGPSDEGNNNGVRDDDDDFWSRYDNYYPQNYKWNERMDPCADSYYTRDKWAMRNILVSNLGLIAKRGTDNSMTVAVTNLLTAKPMEGVSLELLDYQKQVIFKTASDGSGMAKFDLKRKAYLLVAKEGNERGYLKLDDGNSLPLSRFDVSGEFIQRGLKGFIYGERGVWRPGDSIFLTFILQDKLKTLPADHPVEFELDDPEGKAYKRITSTKSIDGFYSFHTATEQSSRTGNWTARVKVGGATFEKKIKIETIMPNRLKINLSFGNAKELTKGDGVAGTLESRWLFGGIAQNLKAKVDAFLSPQTTAFKGYEGYVFDDPTLAFTTQTQTIFDGRLDENGKATIKTDINLEKQAPGQLKANFLVKVFEPGGNFSVQSTSVPYNVYDSYVGIKTPQDNDNITDMLYTGRDNTINIADVNTHGQPVSGSRNVQVELYRIQWRWWWDNSGDDMSNFTQDEYNKLIKTESVRLENGRGQWNLHVDPDDWGRYLIRVKDETSGHSSGKIVYIDWPNWAERLQQSNSTEAAMLSFTSDKKRYKVGEEATLTIPTSSDGRALISIENGIKVLQTHWIDTKKGQTRYSFKIEQGMAPNVFVNVTLLQRHSQTVNDLPIRMYGAIPLTVEDPETILKPVISMPDKLRPEAQSSITVSEASGKEMTYTIAIVDEGLLDITNYKTPDPHDAFYAREALGVKTWDLFDYVIGAYGGGLERIVSIGGDGTNGTNKNVTVNRFKPVVKFLGPFHLDAGDRQTHTFRLPQYIGSVKAMVIAGHEGSYGFAEKDVAVKKPLMILATLPRVLGPSEKIQLPVTVFAMENYVKTVNLQVQSNAFSNLAGNNRKTVTFDKTGDQLVTFDLDVKDIVGAGKVKVTARSGNETANYDVDINIRNPNPPITKVTEKELAPGETWSSDYAPIGMAGTNKTTLEVASIPPLNLEKRLDYLIEYPYGCVEQTTSSGFPQLYLSQIVDLTPRQLADIDHNVKATINRLKDFQVADGGMSYWPDQAESDEWGTNYAGHFMLAAQARGYTLPIGFLENWKKYQKLKAISWGPDTRSFYGSDLIQAYRLYLLALARVPELGAMNRLKEFKYLSDEAKWRLAAAYKLAGQPEVGLQMISGLPLTVKPYNMMYGTYGSDLRDEAMILETLTLLGQQQKASQQFRTVAYRLSDDDWYSTQTTAYSLLAISEYCGITRSQNKLQFSYNSSPVISKSYLWQSAASPNNGKVMLRNNGQNKLYVRLIQKGQPSFGQEPDIANNSDLLQMRVGYFTLNGKPIDPTSLKQGTDFVAQVNIKNPGQRGDYQNLALTQIFPSGWEIINMRLMDNDNSFKDESPSDYRDIRDDRVNTFFSLAPDKEVTYYVLLNAAYAGKYYLPATYCQAMYNNSISALEKGRWVEVVK
ncbi:MAG TPA: MG2 domain-containing protein [Mucilaginibacter sp.]|nr:MG2 domain-containing protein [Mucilaginibacter sp.]